MYRWKKMARKKEERDWSEIISEVRSKARSEVDEFVDEVRPKLKELVQKVRNANFHDEAEELLGKLKKMAEEFSHSDDGPPASKSNTTTRKPLYKDDKGKEWYRASKDWSEAQKKKYRIR